MGRNAEFGRTSGINKSEQEQAIINQPAEGFGKTSQYDRNIVSKEQAITG